MTHGMIRLLAFALLAGACSCWAAAASSETPSPASPAKTSASLAVTDDALAEGAVAAASAKLRDDRENSAGLNLLKFALAVAPENRRVLLLQARLENGLPPAGENVADDGEKFVKLLLSAAAEKSRPLKGRLLLYRAVLLVQPENETALIELMKAKNLGVADTSLDALLAACKGEPGSGPAAPPAQPPATPATPGGKGGENGAATAGSGEAAKGPGEPVVPPAREERVTFFRWDEQKKTVKYTYRPVNKGETEVKELQSFVAENGATVNSPLGDAKQCVKLIDGKFSAKHRVSALSVGWPGQPPLVCFAFAAPVSPRMCRIFAYGWDGGKDMAMPASVTVYDGTEAGPQNKIGVKAVPASRRTGWIEIPLEVKAPCRCVWICIERGPRDNVIVDEVEFK